MINLINNIKNLRDITGAGFLDCKNALKVNNNDIDRSVIYLRKKGIVKALKKSSRVAKEGAIGIYENDKIAMIIEINTETDFAAKNDIFLDFMDLVGKFAIDNFNLNNNSIDKFLELKVENKKISDYFNDIISKIGENIILKKITSISKENKTYIYSYVHNSYRSNIGKICVLLKAEIENNNDKLKKIGKNLCMHIAASKPLALDKNSLDPFLIEKERDIQLSNIKSSGKPVKIIEKILDGKMKKFYSEVTLLNQSYIFDTDKDVKTILSEFSLKDKFKILKFEIAILGS